MNGLNPNPENGRIGPDLNPDSGPTTLSIKVAHGLNQHEVAVPSNSTFGDLKSIIVQRIGLKPEMHKLLFRGKEKEDEEDLQTAGVKNNAKVLLKEDMTCREKGPEEIKETSVISRGGAAVAEVREEIDKLAEQVAALQAVVDSGTKVDNKDIIYLTEMLMRQLLKLDGIEAEGEGKVQRKMEVRRVQSFVETMDILKSRNANPFSSGNNTVSVTTQWETFETGNGSGGTFLAAPSSVSTAQSTVFNPTSTPAPRPVPSSTPASTPVPPSTPAPSPSPVPHSMPAPSPVPHSTPAPSPVPHSLPPVPHSLPMPSSPVPHSLPMPSSTPHSLPPVPHSSPMPSSPVPHSSPMPSSTKITQEWEHFD